LSADGAPGASSSLRLAPALTLAVLLAPIGAGLVFTALPAFGYFPAIGGTLLSLQPWRDLFAYPGFASSLLLTLRVGFGATLLSLALAVGLAALMQESRLFRRLQAAMVPLLATPHAGVALGFAFLLAPSGWLARLASPWLTGWQRPPDLATVHDAAGLAFIAGLVLKEVPYLLLMIAGALGQIPARPVIRAGRAMGYAPVTAWIKLLLPLLYPQLRLPIYAVLAFSLSVVEVGIILGPGTPPPLAILSAGWFADYDLRLYFPAAAAAILQGVVVALAIGLWRAGEVLLAAAGRAWLRRGGRGGAARLVGGFCGGLGGAALVLGFAGLLAMVLWSFAASWRFPEAMPGAWTTANWMAQAREIARPFVATLWIALTAAALALLLTVACLENEARRRLHPGTGTLWLVYLPLLVPQIAFLFGVQLILLRLGLDGAFAAVVWAHLLFVFPYVFLSLAEPWRSLDPRLLREAAALGAGPLRILLRIKLPILLRSLLIAFAVGFAVSVGQYLPTIFAGAGRIATLTTDAVTLSGSADRRVIGLYACLQAVLPLLVFAGAVGVPAALYRHRRGVR
jgi:putative thiamine transport system permease protein